MRFDIITIFPEFFHGPLNHGVLSRAISSGIVSVVTHDLRNFAHDKHRTVDDRPFGGGEGMVLKPEPLVEAVESLDLAPKESREVKRQRVVLLSAQGHPFTQALAFKLAELDRIVFLCGRYEGVDERVNQLVVDHEISIGDYILSGGELAAAVLIDAIARLLPGVLGNEDSSRYESFGGLGEQDASVPHSTHDAGGLLDYPHYTRPAEFRGLQVPQVLSSGDHAQIRAWRRRQALKKTLANRPDLIDTVHLSKEDAQILDQFRRAKSDETV
jgi:tRNA (guanine37-N1)-methyltransferase